MLFSAFYTCQNLASTVLDDDGLGNFGFYTVSALYFGITISSITSTATVNKLGLYKCLILGSFFTFTFVLVNILPAVYNDYPSTRSWFVSKTTMRILLILSALGNGFGAGILWCAEGNYTSACATEQSKGYFFGLFWFIFMSS